MRTYHESWTNDRKRSYLEQRVKNEADYARTAALEGEWREVEKALTELWELGR